MASNRPLIFLNLSNGVVYPGPFDGLVRIQSTWCEQKLWSRIIEDLDYTFLIPLALGRRCVVVDVSARKAEPRAIYQGLPWIKFALETHDWFHNNPGDANRAFLIAHPEAAYVKGMNVGPYFMEQYLQLSDAAKVKLKYQQQFASYGVPIRLNGLSINSSIDGDYTKVKNRLHDLYQIEEQLK